MIGCASPWQWLVSDEGVYVFPPLPDYCPLITPTPPQKWFPIKMLRVKGVG